jgi:adenylate cyclase
LLGQAIERDPHYGPALALAAHSHQLLAANGWADDQETNRRKSIDLARRALRFAPDDPDVLAFAGFALGYFGDNTDIAIELIDRSLALNPSFARGWYWSGVLRIFAGQLDLAIEHLDIFLRLSPRDRMRGRYLAGVGVAHFFNRQFEDALAKLLVSLEELPWPLTYRFLAACYAHMGLFDKAREVVERLRVITPVVVPSIIPYRNPEHRELFLSGLRLAIGDTT